MAIQVGGTTVINNSRTLQNVGGLKTINGTSILGSGNISAGASTTYGAVGTYLLGRAWINQKLAGSTIAGSNVRPAGFHSTAGQNFTDSDNIYGTWENNSQSGTWRLMGSMGWNTSSTFNRATVLVRIS